MASGDGGMPAGGCEGCERDCDGDGSCLRPTYGDIEVLWEIDLFLRGIQRTQNRARRLIGSLILEIALDRWDESRHRAPE